MFGCDGLLELTVRVQDGECNDSGGLLELTV